MGSQQNKPGAIGILSVGGAPGRYTLKRGLTGETLAEGGAIEILKALAAELRCPDDATVEVVAWEIPKGEEG